MKHSHKKSFDWYSMQQRYSIRKYYFGAVSVLLGTALVLGAAASVQTVQAEENKQETTNSISVGREKQLLNQQRFLRLIKRKPMQLQL